MKFINDKDICHCDHYKDHHDSLGCIECECIIQGSMPCSHEACKEMLTLWDRGACVYNMIQEKKLRC